MTYNINENNYNRELFCHNLPTTPSPDMGKILVTGGTGYIGGRLIPELLARGYQVRVMVRGSSLHHKQNDKWPGAEIVESNGLDKNKLNQALENVHTIYYLIHSLLLGQAMNLATDIKTATNFREIAENQNVKRIIYLGGLGDVKGSHSRYLKSRMKVSQIFLKSTVPTTILRLPIIIGSGSAAYEIIENVVRKIPVILIPYWARTKCQPISIRDVIKYLVGVLETNETTGKSFEIGGQDVLSIEKMMKAVANILNKKRLFIASPFSEFMVYAYVTSFLTPVPATIIKCIIGGCKYNSVCENDDIKKYLHFDRVPFKEMVIRAMRREQQDEIHTRWSDSYPPAHSLAIKFTELREPPQYTSSYSILTEKPAESLFKTICNIGGREGWFNSNFLWRMRGWFDRILMGVGTSRGRKSNSKLHINDVIDFWRVETLKQNEFLLLRAEMKLPGMGWLEFKIEDEGIKKRLTVKAYYKTNTLAGKLYWFLFLPSHSYIFSDMVKQIEKAS